MKTIFLGGTCNGSLWREALIPLLKINYFNPVVAEWTPADQARELEARKNSDFVLYTITPKMNGFYAIAEAVDDSNKRKEKTIVCIMDQDEGYSFNPHQIKSLNALKKLIISNGAACFNSLKEVADYANS